MDDLPTPDDIRVATDALRADAREWNARADVLDDAAARAERLHVPATAFSQDARSVADAHEALRVKIAMLLRQGSDRFRDIAVALRTAAAQYDADEAADAHRIRGIY